MNYLKDLREEFRLKNFGFSHDKPGHFATLQCGTSLAQVIWLLLWTLYFLVVTVVDYTVYKEDEGVTRFRLLSNWDFTLIPITSCWDLSCTAYIAIKRKDIITNQCKDMTWYTRIQWVLYNIINSAAMVVTLMYWTLLPVRTDYSSINRHGINMVFVFLNMCVTAKPIRLLHVYQPMAFTFIYAIFSVIYQKSGGGAIYDPLDWNKPGRTSSLVVPAILLAVPLFHSAGFLIFKLRQLTYCILCKLTWVTDNVHEARELANQTIKKTIVTTSKDTTIF